jgi:hypothetical protein
MSENSAKAAAEKRTAAAVSNIDVFVNGTFPSFDSFQKPLGRSKLYLPTDFGA